VCATVTPVSVVPSPKSQEYSTICPSWSDEAPASKSNSAGMNALFLLLANAAVGFSLGAIVTERLLVACRPPESVTVSVTVNVPASWKVWWTEMPLPVPPSPNSRRMTASVAGILQHSPVKRGRPYLRGA